ncbi:2,3,4,5-tetrahydropyridine-2,6-dicarboxylate N-acetyltransferase [compost metagenome]
MKTLRENSGITISGQLPPLHRDSWFESPVVIQAALAPMNLIQIGAFTGIYGGKLGHCRVGRYCSIAPGVDIASDQHPITWLSTSMIQYVPNIHGWGTWIKENGEKYCEPIEKFSSNNQVTIGNDVWIGQGVFVKSGVHIGNGAVVAAHSVVSKDVPDYAVVAGVPARIIKFRFNDSLIERMGKVEWWNYCVTSLEGVEFSDPDRALDRIESAIDSGELLPMRFQRFLVTKDC